MIRCVVTGANGHVGASLVRQLLARGDQVRALVRHDNPESLRGLDVEYVRGDVRDYDCVRAAVEGAEIVYHLAAVISISGHQNGVVRAVNVGGVRNVGRAALDAGVRRMVHMSSIHAFEAWPLDQPLDEGRARAAADGPAYNHSKASGEAALRELITQGLDAVILHPSGIIGPHDFGPSRMGQVLLNLFHQRIPGLIAGGFDWVDVRDVASAAIAAAERGRTNHSYLVSGHYWTIAAIAALAARVTNAPSPALVCPIWLANLAVPLARARAAVTRAEPLFTYESLQALRGNRRLVRTKAFEELGHDPRPTHESVRDAYAWFAAQGRAPELPEALAPYRFGPVPFI